MAHDFYVIDSKVEEVGRALGLDEIGMDRDVTELSGGQRTKVLLAKLLLEKSLVAVVPGIGFGVPNFVRLSYAISTENIVTGMDRLEAFLNRLQ